MSEQTDRPGKWFERLPGWGAGERAGVGPGLQGPDYSQPRPAQPGEAADLLPRFEGPDPVVAQENRAKIQRGEQPRGQLRLPPYLRLDGPLTYNDGAGVFNLVDLGKPSLGWRWLIRQLGCVSQTVVDDPSFTGVRAHYYIGSYRPGVGPSQTEWAWSLFSLLATDFTLSKTWTSNALQVQSHQHLFVYLTHGLNGYGFLPFARVEQVPDAAVPLVSDV